MKPMRTLLLAGSFALTFAGSAMAAPVVTVRVPFPFTVRDQVLPAGDYRVERSEVDPSVLVIRGEHGTHAIAISRSTTAPGEDPAGDRCALVFKHDGNGYRLKDVWEDRYDGQELWGR